MEDCNQKLRKGRNFKNLEHEKTMNEELVKLSYNITLKFSICKILHGSTTINLLGYRLSIRSLSKQISHNSFRNSGE